jgi:RNA polymerase sigma factor (sigma-70 family)
MHLKDEEIFEGIKMRDGKTVEALYRSYFPGFKNYVLRKNGSVDDARDVFQEAILVIFRNFNKEGFKLTSSFDTYMYAVCKNLWGKYFTDMNKHIESNADISNYDFAEEETEVMERHKKYDLYVSQFNKLSKDCRKVLRYFAKKVSLREIAEKMGYSEAYAKKRKFLCKKKLVENIKNLENDEKFKHQL